MRLQCQRSRGAAQPAQLRHVRPQARSVQCQAAAAQKKTEYTNDLRKAAIALHTREQLGGANKKGATGEKKATKDDDEAERAARPDPTLEGYLRFLQESRIVFEFYERTIYSSTDPQLKMFLNTGLERTAALDADLAWFQEEKSMELLPDLPDGPGATYVEYLTTLADKDVPSFLCHYYNTYFAHMSGGAMIGKSVANKLLDSYELEFYKYPTEGDPKKTLGAVVKDKLNEAAESWDAEVRQRSIDETKQTFRYSGLILRCIFGV